MSDASYPSHPHGKSLERVVNYLAHVYFGGSGAEARAGALLGDFVKGPVGNEWPAGIAHGIRLHRRLDVVTDAHPAWRASRARFPAHLRRFAGIAVDMIYDHFLARHWPHHHSVALSHFTDSVYTDVAAFSALFPARLERLFPRMAAEDWLAAYADFAAIEAALLRMSARSPRAAPLAATGPAARVLYGSLRKDCEWFLQDMRRATMRARRELGPV